MAKCPLRGHPNRESRSGTLDKLETDRHWTENTDRVRTADRHRDDDRKRTVRRRLIIWKMCQKTWRFDKNLDDVKK